jgi:ribonuclease D
MITITTTDDLAAFCARAAQGPYVTIDTEFLRERTYYAKLCLLQMAIPHTGPGDGDDAAVLVDPIAGRLSLEPLYELFRNPGVVKVFHAARQDLEIFFVDAGVFPEPLFDTQVAAMVAGFGEQVGYETLVRKIAKASLDKTSRFTDWSRRPLSDAQKVYALADVTHLRVIYEHLKRDLDRSGRAGWVEEEHRALVTPDTYIVRPEDAWERIRTRTGSPRFLAILRELARFREEYAQRTDVPRTRVMKDDVLLELASTKPVTPDDLSRSRLLQREGRKGEVAEGILSAVKRALDLPQDALPRPDTSRDSMQVNGALADLLRVLLKARAEQAGVAVKLIASSADLDEIAAGRRDVPPLQGWRHQVFGADAIRLCEGRLALRAVGQSVDVVEL